MRSTLDAGRRARAASDRSARRLGQRSRDSPRSSNATTAIAFELFRDGGVEIAVLEVGLGGRLDATNIVSPIAARHRLDRFRPSGTAGEFAFLHRHGESRHYTRRNSPGDRRDARGSARRRRGDLSRAGGDPDSMPPAIPGSQGAWLRQHRSRCRAGTRRQTRRLPCACSRP